MSTKVKSTISKIAEYDAKQQAECLKLVKSLKPLTKDLNKAEVSYVAIVATLVPIFQTGRGSLETLFYKRYAKQHLNWNDTLIADSRAATRKLTTKADTVKIFQDWLKTNYPTAGKLPNPYRDEAKHKIFKDLDYRKATPAKVKKFFQENGLKSRQSIRAWESGRAPTTGSNTNDNKKPSIRSVILARKPKMLDMSKAPTDDLLVGAIEVFKQSDWFNFCASGDTAKTKTETERFIKTLYTLGKELEDQTKIN